MRREEQCHWSHCFGVCVCVSRSSLFFHLMCVCVWALVFCFRFVRSECDRLYFVNTRVSHKCETIACIRLSVSNRAFEIFVEFSNMSCCCCYHCFHTTVALSTALQFFFLCFFCWFFEIWLFFLTTWLCMAWFSAWLGLANFVSKNTTTTKLYFQSKPLKVLLLFGFKLGNSYDSH